MWSLSTGHLTCSRVVRTASWNSCAPSSPPRTLAICSTKASMTTSLQFHQAFTTPRPAPILHQFHHAPLHHAPVSVSLVGVVGGTTIPRGWLGTTDRRQEAAYSCRTAGDRKTQPQPPTPWPNADPKIRESSATTDPPSTDLRQ